METLMTEVRTFRAASLREALAIVRRELGDDAVILSTRQVTRRRFLPWLRHRKEFEVVAGITDAGAAPADPSPAARRELEPSRAAHPGHLAAPLPASPSPPAERGVLDTGIALDADGATVRRAEPGSAKAGSGSTEPVAAITAAVTSTTGSGRSTSGIPSRQDDPVSERLQSIEQMLSALARTRAADSVTDIPDELFQLYTDLLDNDVDERLARELIVHLRTHCRPDLWADRAAVHAELVAHVESLFRCHGPIVPVAGERKVVALVGPTGVGKTTTLAKLAANFRLRDRIRMGLVTVDTYRIAAVEQLRTYAEIIDLPMAVVTSPREMRRAVREFESMDLVLIDTAGRSPRDELQIKELRSLLAEADVDEVHLVLSLTSSVRTIVAAAERFAEAGTTALVLTKLDEVAGLGTLLSVARNVDLPISYLTTGQDVPQDIEIAAAGRMSRLVLGLEPVQQRSL
ncbi:MAG: flagellar biosynthesis protein FlhF [Planctomycetota bacterium]|nr:MAG: flagellar biosynthesis protein FlhF [Planctomycetota bacterium]